MLPDPPDIILLREDMDPDTGKIRKLRELVKKSFIINNRDVKLLLDHYDSKCFWLSMAYMMILFQAVVIIAMSYLKE